MRETPSQSVWLGSERFSSPPHLLAVPAESALKLVEDAVILVQVAQLAPKVVVNVDLLDRCLLVTNIPDLEREVIARENVVAIL